MVAPADPNAAPLVFRNARLVDPASGLDEPGSLMVREGRIASLAPGDPQAGSPEGAEIIECGGHVLAPGLIDCRVFAGEPGFEFRETLGGASRAAARGGVTRIVCRPDTDPVIDDVALVDYVKRRARDRAIVHAHPMAALTKGLAGKEMTEIGLLAEAGAVAFTDADRAVADAQVMRNLLTYASAFGALVVQHPEDADLTADGVMNEGEISMRLGLPGMPAASETVIVDRDMRLVALTGGRYHASTISCADTLARIGTAKSQGLPVTCGVSINNLVLNEIDVGAYRTFFKLRPPLRGEDDRTALVDGLSDGTIDVIVSDHDPQDADSKRRPFVEAGWGAIGLETMLSAALGLVHESRIGLGALLATVTCNPARLLGLDAGRLESGLPADLVLIDLDTPFVVVAEDLVSKCQNTAFERRRMQGRAAMTVVNGRIVHDLMREPVDA